MIRIPTYLCLLLLTACAGNSPTIDAGQRSNTSNTPVASVAPSANLQVQFENLLADKLFHLAVQDIQAAGVDERFQKINAQYLRLTSSLNLSRLSASNRLQLRLFVYLWEIENQKMELQDQSRKNKKSIEADNHLFAEYTLIYLPQGGALSADNKTLGELANAELLNLHGKIRTLTNSGHQISMESIFDSARDNPDNYLSDSEFGRQEYLTRIVDNLLVMEKLLLSFLNITNHKEFTVEGFEDSADTSNGLIFYDKEDATLRVGIGDMKQLPLFEIEGAALYYGVPGMHSINSITPLFEIQSLISLPGFEKGWAAYAVSNLDRIPHYQHPQSDLGRTYFEAMLTSLAIVDLSLHTKNWTQEQAIKFALENSPFPENRLRTYIEQIRLNPGLFAAPLLVRLEIENMKVLSEGYLKQKFDLVEFNNTIVNAGPMPLTELQVVISQWIKTRLAETDTNSQHQ